MSIRSRLTRGKWLFALIVSLLIGGVVFYFNYDARNLTSVSINDFMAEINAGTVISVELVKRPSGDWEYVFGDKMFTVPSEQTPSISQLILDKDIVLTTGIGGESMAGALIFGGLVSGLTLVFFYFIFNLGRFAAWKDQLKPERSSVRFSDIAGLDDVEEDMRLLVDYLKNPEQIAKLGGRPPRGVLFIGSAGVGKTLMAKAIAGEASVPFLNLVCSGLVETFAGTGPQRIHSAFEVARAHAPCILFMDELDSLSSRTSHGTDLAREDNKTINQLLAELDGFLERTGILVIAASNRQDMLDKALLRPGRFDRKIIISKPDVEAREQILALTCKNRGIRVSEDVQMRHVAQTTFGFTGADLVNMLNEAALLAGRSGGQVITMQEIERARDTMIMGRESAVAASGHDREIAAYHEAGHVVMALSCKNRNRRLHKVTIAPHGQMLGAVMRVSVRDEHSHSRQQLKEEICIALGGRVAEELIFGDENVTSGSANDIKIVTAIARHMVIEWGMSAADSSLCRDLVYCDTPMLEGVDSQNTDRRSDHTISEQTAQRVDAEIARIVKNAREKTERIIKKNRDALEKIAKALLEKETLTGDEVEAIVADASFHN